MVLVTDVVNVGESGGVVVVACDTGEDNPRVTLSGRVSNSVRRKSCRRDTSSILFPLLDRPSMQFVFENLVSPFTNAGDVAILE